MTETESELLTIEEIRRKGTQRKYDELTLTSLRTNFYYWVLFESEKDL